MHKSVTRAVAQAEHDKQRSPLAQGVSDWKEQPGGLSQASKQKEPHDKHMLIIR